MLVAQGVVQTLAPYVEVTTLEGAKQVVPLGPAASQIAIKQLGTNGGGFFGVNSAHPFENPTPLTNFLQMLAILLLPAAQVFMFGRLVGSRRHAWALFSAMLVLLVAALGVSLWSEFQGNPTYAGIAPMEGKETRFGVMNSVLWAVTTTAASNGSVNAMHDSLMPLSGLTALFNIMLGEVVFGGVGAGLYGMLAFVLLTVFMAGLMVGRSPEYLGKRIEKREIIMAMIAVLAPCAVILSFSALALMTGDRAVQHHERRATRLEPSPVCLLVNGRQQRQRLRGPQREYPLLQPPWRGRHAHREIRCPPADARHRGQSGGQESVSANVGNLPDRRAAVRHPVAGGRIHCRGADVSSRAHPRPAG